MQFRNQEIGNGTPGCPNVMQCEGIVSDVEQAERKFDRTMQEEMPTAVGPNDEAYIDNTIQKAGRRRDLKIEAALRRKPSQACVDCLASCVQQILRGNGT